MMNAGECSFCNEHGAVSKRDKCKGSTLASFRAEQKSYVEDAKL